MTRPVDTHEQASADEAFLNVQELSSLSVLAELVHNRIKKEQHAGRQRWLAVIISVLGLILPLTTYQSFQIRDVERGVTTARDSILAQTTQDLKAAIALLQEWDNSGNPETVVESPFDIPTLDNTAEVYVPADSSMSFAIQDRSGMHTIDAIGRESFDPFIILYRINDDGSRIRIAADDDGGEGLSSQLAVVLSQQANYELEVREYASYPGDVIVSIGRTLGGNSN